ncbi:flagellin lysine-N-methylase [Oscillibacter sp.]|uniref:flagellin lysine-N-methylase n=1 Tax=Oscillibacter sp. TaxID=1945593 RepID=UPI0026396122|nr:flagellin lysine-N-methylase [Oscillibacter sp.]MDD3347762.1 flagellin lysine-N-methylase [Oscillibacter sp.]
MLIRTPDYESTFRCLAGACPHTCCAGWEVVVDEETARCYETVPGALGEKLRGALRRDEEGDACFLLDGGRCPFLDRDNLCEIHRTLGEAATSVTCREHPRFIEEYGPFREITFSASCPAANALLLGSNEPLRFRETETGEAKEPGDPWLSWLAPLRESLLDLLRWRRYPLKRRLAAFLHCAARAQTLLEEERPEQLPTLTENMAVWAEEPIPAMPALFPAGLRFLGTLEILEPDWPEILKAAERTPSVSVPEALLERIAVYFAFRYLLKAVNDGDFLSRAQLCVFAVACVERLSAVCPLEEALRRFSCEIEHSEENLEALLSAFRREEALSWTALLRQGGD